MRYDPAIRHRLFFATRPDPAEAARIHRFSGILADGVPRIRAEHLHETLAITRDYDTFPREVAERLIGVGDTICGSPFDLTLSLLVATPRSVALRPHGKVPLLSRLQKALATGMSAAGEALRQGWQFSPHMTLLYRDGPPFNRKIDGFRHRVDALVLIHSLVGRTRHEILKSWPLTGAPEPDDQLSLF